MKNLSYSFDKETNTYFVFDLDTGKTIKKGIPDVSAARHSWLMLRGVG